MELLRKNHLNSEVNNLILETDALLESKEVARAFELLHVILAIEPGYTMAHNYLGWVHTHFLIDYTQAKAHLRLAIHFDPNCHAAYGNMAILLQEMNAFSELEEHIESALKVPGTDHAYLILLKARCLERKGQLINAWRGMKEAQLLALNSDFIINVDMEIMRVKLKMSPYTKVKLLVLRMHAFLN